MVDYKTPPPTVEGNFSSWSLIFQGAVNISVPSGFFWNIGNPIDCIFDEQNLIVILKDYYNGTMVVIDLLNQNQTYSQVRVDPYETSQKPHKSSHSVLHTYAVFLTRNLTPEALIIFKHGTLIQTIPTPSNIITRIPHTVFMSPTGKYILEIDNNQTPTNYALFQGS